MSPIVYCDNVSAGYLAKTYVLHSHTKHVDIDFHFLRKKVILKALTMEYTPT